MQQALTLARSAFDLGEVPVGALVLMDGQIIGSGTNRTIADADPTAHAEIIALRAAAKHLGNHRLNNAMLVCTLEPCAMCVGALVHARVAKLVYGADEPKTGACGSAFDLLSDPAHGHLVAVEKGLMADASRDLLQQFFRARRGVTAPVHSSLFD